MATVDELYRQITDEQPSRLGTRTMLLNLYEGFAEHIENIRARIGKVGEDDAKLNMELEKNNARFKKFTGIDPLPPAECRVLINKLSEEFNRQVAAHRLTPEYAAEQERMRDFLD